MKKMMIEISMLFAFGIIIFTGCQLDEENINRYRTYGLDKTKSQDIEIKSVKASEEVLTKKNPLDFEGLVNNQYHFYLQYIPIEFRDRDMVLMDINGQQVDTIKLKMPRLKKRFNFKVPSGDLPEEYYRVIIDPSNMEAISTNYVYVRPDPEYYMVKYQVHMKDIGWDQNWRYDGEMAGSEGNSTRTEAIKINIGNSLDSDIEYIVHLQKKGPFDNGPYGWNQGWKKNGETAGTTSQSRRLEAIKIKINNPYYRVRYKSHIENKGWQDWKYDGEVSGTTDKGLRLEAIHIEIVENESAFKSTTNFIDEIPIMMSNTSPNGIASCSSKLNEAYDAWLAFDGDDSSAASSRWISATGPMPAWIAYDFKAHKKIRQYYILPEFNSNIKDRCPQDFRLQGSNGGPWVTIDVREDVTWDGSGKYFSVSNPEVFTKYRLYIDKTNREDSLANSGVVSIRQFKLDE